ncbi:unnamed protein product, partial [Ectocarpus sp. 6 AP-2014]
TTKASQHECQCPRCAQERRIQRQRASIVASPVFECAHRGSQPATAARVRIARIALKNGSVQHHRKLFVPGKRALDTVSL